MESLSMEEQMQKWKQSEKERCEMIDGLTALRSTEEKKRESRVTGSCLRRGQKNRRIIHVEMRGSRRWELHATKGWRNYAT